MEIKQIILRGLEECKGSVDQTLDGLSADEINWHPKPNANSIALILFHIARSEDTCVSILSGKPSLWETANWNVKLKKNKSDKHAHFTADEVANFTLANTQDLVVYFNAARERYIDFINGFSPDRFDDKVILPAPPLPSMDAPPRSPPASRKNINMGIFLVMTLIHSVGHIGEMSYIRGLKRGVDK